MVNLPVRIEEKFLSMDLRTLGKDIETTMSLFGTDMNRATHYNTKEELAAMSEKEHRNMFSLDRTIYGCIACLPGTTDISKMKVVTNLLGIKWNPGSDFQVSTPVLTMDQERMIIDHLVSTLPPNRMINLFASFEDNRVNNARMRKTVLPFILNSTNFGWWAIKYRKKLKTVLSHCWGKRMSSVIEAILGKEARTNKEDNIIHTSVSKYLVGADTIKYDSVIESLCFIFSVDFNFTNPLFVNFHAAKTDFSKAKGLPKEIIEGIRAAYHPTIDKAETLKVAKSSMTSKEKRLVQNQAQKAGVEVKWNPYSQPLVELLIYGFKMGFTNEIHKAIEEKAYKAAQLLPFNYEKVGIICDDSFSMSGSEDQKLKALAITYATVEMLKHLGNSTSITTVSKRRQSYSNKPAGETNLAKPLISLLKHDLDAIFVVSDGYENAPEGRFGEVLKIARDKAGVDIPVYHFNPVGAAESKVALKRLSNDVPLTPVTNPEKMGLSLFKTMIAADPKQGLIELFNIVLPNIEKTKQLYARQNPNTITR
ncbi:MAG: hypothetical protein DRP42_06295 [Tenericutes bacterium]|nr:MAG: hypothetical protein DRP42_06295 [Mycoplasmatota bacterium]